MVSVVKDDANQPKGTEVMMKKINVIVVDKDPSRASLLHRALIEYGYTVLLRLTNGKEMIEAVDRNKADVIVIGIDLPDADTLFYVAKLSDTNPHPVVMFAEKDAPKIVQQVVKAGVSAFIVDDIQPQRIESIIEVAMARFEEYQGLRNELQDAKSKLEDRKTIDKAKGLIMKQQGINEDEAYKKLRKLAMDKGQTMAKIAENIIDVFSLLNAKV